MSVWPSTRSTQLISDGICFSRSSSAPASLSSSARPSGRSAACAAVEEHFRLEHEAVADDADVRPVAEDVAQLAEEVRAVARQFLHALRQRHVQPLAEIGDAQLRILVLLLRSAERIFERADLAAQRADLLVEILDLRHGARGRLLLQVDLVRCRLRPVPARDLGSAPAASRSRSRSPSAADSDARSCATWSSRLALPVCSSDSSWLSRAICALSRSSAVSLPATSCDRKNCATMKTVSRKMTDRIQRRQGVDEARPVIHAAVAAAAGERHGRPPE